MTIAEAGAGAARLLGDRLAQPVLLTEALTHSERAVDGAERPAAGAPRGSAARLRAA